MYEKNDKRLTHMVNDITAELKQGKKYQAPGFGTFSTCTRKATQEHAACTMAMFRASAEFRDYSSGGRMPAISGPHKDIVKLIAKAVKSGHEVTIPRFGLITLLQDDGAKPRLIFHGAAELNGSLTES